MFNYAYGSHLIDWLALGAVIAIALWAYRASKIRPY
jgi:hypothetical protein